MNVEAQPLHAAPDPALWEQAAMRNALAARDFTLVFTLMRRAGMSQRAIAALTGLAASEVYEVTHGRKVMSYDVLVRLADGLEVPRGYLGLAYDADTAALLGAHRGAMPPVAAAGDPRADAEDARRLLEHAAEVTVGVNTRGSDHGWTTTPDRTTPLPRRADASDVEQIEHITAGLRSLDNQHGGGACREAVLAHSRWVRQLLHLAVSDDVRGRLHRTLADLHNLAGWTSFDVGLHADARRHFALALTHAREAAEPSLVANVLYRIGRIHLHARRPDDALRFLQLGHVAARDVGGGSTAALLWANEAWAYGMAGNTAQALRSLGLAEEELTRADHTQDGPWVTFLGRTDLTGITGMTYLELAGAAELNGPVERAGSAEHLERAEEALTDALIQRGDSMPRSRAFDLSGLSTVQTRRGDVAAGIETGYQAVQLAERLRSARVWDRLQPVAAVLAGINQPDARDLRQLILPEPVA